MKESEWLASIDAAKMLRWAKGRVSERKVRLFACACCRLAWQLLTHAELREAVRYAEEYADGEADQMVTGCCDSERICRTAGLGLEEKTAAHLATICCGRPQIGIFSRDWHGNIGSVSSKLLGKAAADVAREVIGNPHRPYKVNAADPRQVLSVRRPWRDGGITFYAFTVDDASLRIAQDVYDGRLFGELPILADALEDAGCTSSPVLEHLRSPGPHFRGCWALDAVLGKE